MAHNFRLDGGSDGLYFAKVPSGNDSNNGFTPNTPKATLPSLLAGPNSNNYNAIIGAGDYKGVSNLGKSANNIIIVNGDGLVTIEFVAGGGITNRTSYNNLTLINAGLISTAGATGVNITTNNNITFKNYNAVYTGTLENIFTYSKFINSTFEQAYNINFCIFINSQFNTRNANFKNSYLDFNSRLVYLVNLNPSSFSNNNIQGLITLEGNNYAIQDQLTGTPQDNGYAVGVNWLTEAQLTSDGYTGIITGWDAAVATCINRDPGFNNASLEDFSLQADSPHIGRANNGGNIGGTDIANTVLVNQNGVGNIEILTTPEIDTSNPNAYTVDVNEDEGYVDIIRRIGTQSFVLLLVEPIALLEYDSDIEGGQVGNRNVPDSEPLTTEYPRKLTTTSLAPNTTTLNVTGHDVVVGEFVRVLGEDREVTAVTTDTITVGTAFRAAVASGVTFQVGSEVQLAALRPNRLTYQLRVSTQATKPQTEAEWDNGLDPVYNYAGQFSTQEYYTKPTYIINGNNVLGGGDSEADPNITPDEIPATWTHERVWLRNNYSS